MSHCDYRAPVIPTPFHSRTTAACRTNDWARWAGYTTVNVYTEVELEYAAIRNQTSVFDLSPMVKYRIAGPDATRYLNHLMTRNLNRLAPGRVAYVVWCNDDGKVLDDGTLFRFDENEFRLCVQDRHLPWLLDAAIGYNVEIQDVSQDIAALALQGPTSCAVLKRFGLRGIETLRPFYIAEFPYREQTLTVSRTGFTGDLGYELWIDPAQAELLWDDLMIAGRDHGITSIGSRALDLVRIEAGFILPHADFMPAEYAFRHTRGRSPFELELGWQVDFEKGHFNGRRALLNEQRLGSRYQLVGLDIEGNKPAQDALVYYAKRRRIGHVTSAMWSPICKRNIALATLEAGRSLMWDKLWVDIYVKKELKWERIMARCRVVDRPFYKPARRTATPAPDY
ncbi:MAG: aminomethyltransferase family protein [Acidiferrobacterales bacterium]